MNAYSYWGLSSVCSETKIIFLLRSVICVFGNKNNFLLRFIICMCRDKLPSSLRPIIGVFGEMNGHHQYGQKGKPSVFLRSIIGVFREINGFFYWGSSSAYSEKSSFFSRSIINVFKNKNIFLLRPVVNHLHRGLSSVCSYKKIIFSWGQSSMHSERWTHILLKVYHQRVHIRKLFFFEVHHQCVREQKLFFYWGLSPACSDWLTSITSVFREMNGHPS